VSAIEVTAPKGRAADVAPVKSSLLATEPQAIISRKEIEEVAPRIGDYTTTAILAPSMTSSPNPNGPGSTDGGKLSMRGFKDGEFNITYDGIAWGDANGPSHHANSFFPSSTIGGVVIDRGPGDATELGQANFGGQINLFSLPFENKLSVRQTATYASFNTWQSVTTLATGPIKQLHDANFVFNYMTYGTDGYLTYSPSKGQNIFLKGTLPITDHFKVTGLYTWNGDDYHQGDSNSVASVAQTSVYGKRFALRNDPTLQTYTDYNFTKKTTDFEYIRLDGDFGHGLTAENTTYSYAYTNNTLSGNDDTADNSLTILTGSPTLLNKANQVILTPGGIKTPGLPGYYKLNQYRITGDILKFEEDFGFGTATVGAMYEQATTHRSKLDIDLLTRKWDYRESLTGNLPVGTSCAAQGYTAQPSGSCNVPLYINNQEYSGWHQYQIFAQFEWRPTENLRITPGVKYVNFNLFVHAPDDAKILQPVYLSPTFTKVLPFLTVNYRVMPTLAVYAQYAQGFLVPDVSVFNVANPSNNSVVPQESSNYQLGAVYSAGNLSVDADIYYIDFKHKIQSVTIVDPTSSLFNETITTNSGGATYTGAEMQATYVLPYGFSVFGNYSRNNAVAKDDGVSPLNDGFQLPGAPRWTAALGLRSELHHVLVPEGQLVMNVTDKWIGSQTVNGATSSKLPAGSINPYSDVNFSATYSWRNFSIEAQVLNLADSHAITAAKGKVYDPSNPSQLSQAALVGGKPNLNQFTYDIGRSYQITLKAAF
jgi:iron complex outermembrane receptor protein